MRNLVTAMLVIIALSAPANADKPNCEDIKKTVAAEREKLSDSLIEKKDNLDSLRDAIRKGRGKLEGAYGRKPRREQLKLVADELRRVEAEIDALKKSTPLPNFTIRDLEVGDFGYFGKNDYDFRIFEILDESSFTAFIRYGATRFSTRRVAGSVVSFPVKTTKETTRLYLVKGIETEGLADRTMAKWSGPLCCSGTEKLELQSGNETMFVLEPIDVDSCFKKSQP